MSRIASLGGRVLADGKHLSLDRRPFRVRGSTYGTFLPRADGAIFPEPVQIRRDFVAMAAAGLNTVRTYTLPPPDLLNLAGEIGLRVMVGLHYRDWREEPAAGRAARRRVLDAGRRAVDDAMQVCAANPVVLAISVGNEVPADVVRVHGIGSVEATLATLAEHVHAADPAMLATYANFPSTEYLNIDGLDLVCFNVFLEQPDALRRYLRHLQVVAHELPLIISELGLASEIHGVDAQADAQRWQLRAVDEAGCAGATVFSWTDEWGVAGQPVEGWGFGVTDRDRVPKPALQCVADWARSDVRDLRDRWPSFSVVVCAYNEEATIEECLESLAACDYPALEVIVCDDGSTDGTLERARRYPFRVLELPHGGLSAARNAGLAAATGQIVAYLDADAACHPEWPYHLSLSLEDDNVVATGGPNLPVPGAQFIERAVALSPGGPVHVLLADDRAEHVPGCNMAFQKKALQEIDGFDVVYTSAGDDVDVCWKLTDRGYDIGFAAAAQVRHHRRTTVRGYLRQQRGYGRSERMLSGAHRHRFNRLGQARWRGAIYTRHATMRSLLRPVVYHGWLGSAPFQQVAHRPARALLDWASALVPLVLPAFVVLAVLGLLVFPPALVLSAALVALVALYAVIAARSVAVDHREPRPKRLRLVIGLLHVAQPWVRLLGRLRARPVSPKAVPPPAWTAERLVWLETFARECAASGAGVRPGRPFDPWDLEISVGPIVRCRFTAAIVWQWTRLHSCRMRLRPAAVATLMATFAVAVLWSTVALVVPVVILAEGVVEALVLRAKVRQALGRSAPADPVDQQEMVEVAL